MLTGMIANVVRRSDSENLSDKKGMIIIIIYNNHIIIIITVISRFSPVCSDLASFKFKLAMKSH